MAMHDRNAFKRRLLLESILGHLCLLEITHPAKAHSTLARRVRRCAQLGVKPHRGTHAAKRAAA